MSLVLEDFYEKTKERYKLALCTNVETLRKNISWVYLLEDINNCSFMRGGELIITTGLNVNDESQMLELLKQVYAYGACGIIFNLGMYIKEIPEPIIQWGRKQAFPILTMPWEIHISDLMREYCNEILSEKRLQDIREEALLQVLKGNLSEDYKEELSQFVSCYIVAADAQMDMPYLALAEWKGCFYYVCKETHEGIKGVHCGRSNRMENVDDIAQCGVQAYRAMQVSRIKETPMEAFERIGLYNAALAIEDEEVLKQAEKMLEPLEDNLLRDTLRVYLEKNKSVQETADALYLHRNTVNYRIQKSRSLLPEDFDIKPLEYLFAFYLYDCLNLRRLQERES